MNRLIIEDNIQYENNNQGMDLKLKSGLKTPQNML